MASKKPPNADPFGQFSWDVWSRYFNRYGCISCESDRQAPHVGDGLCSVCRSRIERQLCRILRRETSGIPQRKRKNWNPGKLFVVAKAVRP